MYPIVDSFLAFLDFGGVCAFELVEETFVGGGSDRCHCWLCFEGLGERWEWCGLIVGELVIFTSIKLAAELDLDSLVVPGL